MPDTVFEFPPLVASIAASILDPACRIRKQSLLSFCFGAHDLTVTPDPGLYESPMNNYHTHTFRCGHASGDVDDYVVAAHAAGLTELGFSDHVPFPDGLWPESRMTMDEVVGYLAAIKAAAAVERSPAEGGMKILAGFECEWRPDMESYLRDLVPSLGLDYLVAGVHWVPFGGEWIPTTHITRPRELRAFTDYTVKTIRSGLFDFLAHPDIFCARWYAWNDEARACAKEILRTAEAEHLPLEINGYGLRKPYTDSAEGRRPQYPCLHFWELAADYDIDVLVNSDAHRAMDVAASLDEGRSIAELFGLRLIDRITPKVVQSLESRS
jgi:histidinol-phosphatase (PHP family)